MVSEAKYREEYGIFICMTVLLEFCDAPFLCENQSSQRWIYRECLYEECKGRNGSTCTEIDTEVLYQWKDLVPTYEERITRIDGIYMDKVTCESADAIYELKGNSKLPAKNVMIRDVKVGEVKEFVKKVNNVENVVEKNVTYDRKGK